MTDDNSKSSMLLPLVVQLGFAGSRRWFDSSQHSDIDAARFEKEIENWLTKRLTKLREDLGLEPRHFFCGISALAIGGDTVFCKACQCNKTPLRIFLPQTRDEFVSASTKESGPDFPSQLQKDEVTALLDSPGVIQERLVSDFVFLSIHVVSWGFDADGASILGVTGIAVFEKIFRPLFREFFGSILTARLAPRGKAQSARLKKMRFVRIGIATAKGRMKHRRRRPLRFTFLRTSWRGDGAYPDQLWTELPGRTVFPASFRATDEMQRCDI